MSEIDNSRDIKFNIKDRNFSLKKADFKDNSKELFLFNYLTDNATNKKFKSDNKSVSIHMLDQEEGTQGTITSKDIQIFLQDKKIQKKGITEGDMVNFINKMIKLNPTQDEKYKNDMDAKFKDSSGKSVMTSELKEMFGLESRYRKDTDFTDKDNNVKKGFEVFDLNNDGKLDDIEKKAMNKNYVTGYSSIKDLNKYLNELIGDNKSITNEAKQNLYNKVKSDLYKENFDILNNFDIKDENGNKVVTNAIKELFSNNNDSVSFDALVDENQNINKGMELFDLNGDGKLDENEKGYFANGGRTALSKDNQLTIDKLTAAIKKLDAVGYEHSGNVENGQITTQNKRNLHKMLSCSNYMLSNLGSFPDELQDQFVEALKEKYLVETKQKGAVGVNSGNKLGIDAEGITQPEIASIMAHELTHAILSKEDRNMPVLMQEVVTFYTEYRHYENAKKNDPTFISTVTGKNSSGFKVEVVDMRYMNYVEELKKSNPEMSEKDIAIEAFLKTDYDYYKVYYNSSMTPDDMRKADYGKAEDFFKRK